MILSNLSIYVYFVILVIYKKGRKFRMAEEQKTSDLPEVENIDMTEELAKLEDEINTLKQVHLRFYTNKYLFYFIFLFLFIWGHIFLGKIWKNSIGLATLWV